jgi:hypothetical protein
MSASTLQGLPALNKASTTVAAPKEEAMKHSNNSHSTIFTMSLLGLKPWPAATI